MPPDPSPPSLVHVHRGEVEESVHAVHLAVADSRGTLVAWSGDPERRVWSRSAAKPFQALPLVEDGVTERFHIPPAELALCCGSHQGEEAHEEGARSLLARAALGPDALRCGPHPPFSPERARALAARGEAPGRIHNNCSGKHAGMLALAVAHGWEPEGYHRAGHPVQERMAREMARWSGCDGTELATGVDGCGVVCFALPLGSLAAAYARFARAARRDEPAARVVEAMCGHPFMVAGTGRAGTRVMERTGPRAFVKLGAEGVFGGGLPEAGLGFAIKVLDGGRRAVETVLVHLLAELGALDADDLDALPDLVEPPVTNTRDEVVGRLVTELRLRREGAS